MTSPWSNRRPRPPLCRTGPLAHYPLPSSLYIAVRIECATPLSANPQPLTVADRRRPLFSIVEFWLRGNGSRWDRERTNGSKPGQTVLSEPVNYAAPAPASYTMFGRLFAERSRLLVLAVEFARCRAECSVQLAAGCEITTRQLVAAGRAEDAISWVRPGLAGRRRTGLKWVTCWYEAPRCCRSTQLAHILQITAGL